MTDGRPFALIYKALPQYPDTLIEEGIESYQGRLDHCSILAFVEGYCQRHMAAWSQSTHALEESRNVLRVTQGNVALARHYLTETDALLADMDAAEELLCTIMTTAASLYDRMRCVREAMTAEHTQETNETETA